MRKEFALESSQGSGYHLDAAGVCSWVPREQGGRSFDGSPLQRYDHQPDPTQ